MVGLCHDPLEVEFSRIFKFIRLELFEPDDKNYLKRVTTTAVRMTTEALPQSVFRYLAFNVMVISPTSLRSLKRKQLSALEAWLRAGGSLLLLGTDKAGAAQNFVDSLKSAPAVFSKEKGALFVRPDLGRAVLIDKVSALPDEETSNSLWRRIAAFLWKFRSLQLEACLLYTSPSPRDPH